MIVVDKIKGLFKPTDPKVSLPSLDKQLKDVTITIGVVSGEDGTAYATSLVYRYDLDGDVNHFIKHLEQYPGVHRYITNWHYKRRRTTTE